MRKVCAILVAVAVLGASGPSLGSQTNGAVKSVIREDLFFPVFDQQTQYVLDPQAYNFVGLPFERTGVTVIIIDGWGDGHGQTVEAIIRAGVPDAHIIRFDIDAHAAVHCQYDQFDLYVICVQNLIADFVADAASLAQAGPTVINMSLSLFYSNGGRTLSKLAETKGCEDSAKINLQSLKSIRDVIAQSPETALWVASSGNDGQKERLGFPACLSRVYAVAALERKPQYEHPLVLAKYSNYSTSGRSYASPLGGVIRIAGTEYEGTSFSAPLFAALLAAAVSICASEPKYFKRQHTTENGVAVPTLFSARCGENEQK